MNFKEIKKKWQSVPAWIKSPYLLAALLFGSWMLLLDENNMVNQYRKWKQLHDLREKQNFYTENITKTQQELNELKNNPATQEKFAREHYYMKKDNEDVFVVVKTDSE